MDSLDSATFTEGQTLIINLVNNTKNYEFSQYYERKENKDVITHCFCLFHVDVQPWCCLWYSVGNNATVAPTCRLITLNMQRLRGGGI